MSLMAPLSPTKPASYSLAFRLQQVVPSTLLILVSQKITYSMSSLKMTVEMVMRPVPKSTERNPLSLAAIRH